MRKNTITKKTSRSPHMPTSSPSPRKLSKPRITPAARNTMIEETDDPATKKNTPATWKITKDQPGKAEKVIEARMKIEENLRREKRARQMANIRKPLVCTPGTPGNKRMRNAPETWEEEGGDCRSQPETRLMVESPPEARDDGHQTPADQEGGYKTPARSSVNLNPDQVLQTPAGTDSPPEARNDDHQNPTKPEGGCQTPARSSVHLKPDQVL